MRVKMSLLSELRLLRNECEHKMLAAREKLNAAIPKTLNKWQEESGSYVVTALAKQGVAERNYKFSELDNYGFSSPQNMRDGMYLLGSAWGDEVHVQIIICHKDQEVKVIFTAL